MNYMNRNLYGGMNMYQQQLMSQMQQPNFVDNPQQNYTIKGKYVNSIDDVISLQSTDIEPAICVDLSNNKVYIKTFNIDGSFKVEEFVKNENAKIDTRSQSEKLNDVVLQLVDSVSSITGELANIKSELGIGGNDNVKSNGK